MNNPVQNQQRRTGPVGIGLIGAGMISDTYLTNLTSFPDVRVLIVGDINPVRAEAQAKAHHVERWGTPEDVLAHPDVELIVNLTIPAAHIEVATAAIDAGKHVWTEKPLGIDPREREGVPRRGRASRPPGRRRPRHRVRPGAADRSPCHRAGRHRYAAVSPDCDPVPGAPDVPPEPGVPVRHRRGAAVRHRPVLPHCPRPPLGSVRERCGRSGPGAVRLGPSRSASVPVRSSP
jgi:hypothetical protein